MKGYSTKYALTSGIEEVEVRPGASSDEKFVYTEVPSGIGTQLRKQVTFFTTKAAAEQNAREQAERKRASLLRQAAELKRLERTPKWKG